MKFNACRRAVLGTTLILSSVAVHAADAQRASYDCLAKENHDQVRACLQAQAAEARTHLDDSFNGMLDRIRHSAMSDDRKRRMTNRANETHRAFASYRDAACRFAASTADAEDLGEDRRLACEAVFDDQQGATWKAYWPPAPKS